MAELSHMARIMVLEDEGLIALDIESTLLDAGAKEITSVSTVADALAALEAGSFDAAILDLRLGADGWAYEVADSLRARGIPFVFSSGSAEIADGYRDVPLVSKPFTSDQLVAALVGITPSTIHAAE